jgi:hypothetical protein
MLVKQTTKLLDDKDAPTIFKIMFALNVEIQTFLLFLNFFSNEEIKRIFFRDLKKFYKKKIVIKKNYNL